MEEVIGSIPIRSTNIPFINSQLSAPASSLLRLRGCGRVRKFLQVQGQHPFYDLQARFALLLVDRAGVDIKRRATAGMSHQLLSNFYVDTQRPEICGE